MGPWDGDVSASEGSGGFWENLTNQLLSGGSQYFAGQLKADTSVKLSNVYVDGLVNMVKFVAIAAAVAFVAKAIFKKLF